MPNNLHMIEPLTATAMKKVSRMRPLLPVLLMLLAGFASGALADNPKTRPKLKLPVPPPIASQAYKDLPGVKRPEDRVDENAYACDTDLARTRGYRSRGPFGDERRYRDGLWDDGLPVLVYRCTRGPVTFESTRQPVSRDWLPGINPRDLSAE
jgi:hypothetical protein